MKKVMVKLNNGKQVSLEEFVTWTSRKQTIYTQPIEERKAHIERKVQSTKRAINTPLGQFSCFEEARKALNMGTYSLRTRLKNLAYPEYSYVNPKPKDSEKEFYHVKKKGKKFTVTPIGMFNSKIEAYISYGLKKGDFETLLREQPSKYYYLDEEEAIKFKGLKHFNSDT